MRRTCMPFLQDWLTHAGRKPLIMQGARQVGKTWLVEQLAASMGYQLVTLNFEKTPSLAGLFSSNDPHETVRRIEERLSCTIDPHNTILFLDEIQVAPELISKLRWFYEDLAALPVVAAGSLLEFVLGTAPLSMPVGRVSFMYVEPLSFLEFLLALDKDGLVDAITNFSYEKGMNEALHEELMRLFRHYMYVGGMPEAVENWVQHGSPHKVSTLQEHLLSSYRTDFGKYAGRIGSATLNTTLDALPHMLGKKLVLSKLDPLVSSAKNKEALKLLAQARVIHLVQATAAHGLPLAAEVNRKFMKAILLDVGLCAAALHLTLDRLEDIQVVETVNKGGIAEQVVGQLLRTISPCYKEASLYYWLRLKQGADAEVDYVIAHQGSVVPIEVKAGSVGSLRSLHQFMKQRALPRAVRISSGIPTITKVSLKDSQGDVIAYELRSLPFYLISELPRLV